MQSTYRYLVVGAACLIAISLSTATASAQWPQYQPPSTSSLANAINRPTVSPYLNLIGRGFGGGGMPAYQTLVRPQIEQRQAEIRNAAAIQQLQLDVNRRAGSSRTTGESTDVRGTGHASGFMNHMHFFYQGQR